MKSRIAKAAKVVSYFGTYLAELIGMVLIAVGVGMIYQPAGFITAGVLTVVVVEVKA